jgi:hypothetical protein
MRTENEKMVGIKVGGINENLWSKLRSKLIDAINNLLDTEIDGITKTSFGEEIDQFTHSLLQYAKEKLKKPMVDNDKTIAEIQELYSRKQKNLAETRKIHAEAEAMELKNRIRKLKLILNTAKIVLHGNPGEEEILFIKDIDTFLLALNDIDSDKESMV